MLKNLKHYSIVVMAVLLAVVTFSSCNSEKKQTRYVAAKLVDSDMWSIVDLNSGEILYKDEFKSQPSVIVDGIFCVKNEGGLYDYYSVDDVKKPLNKGSFLHATSFSDEGVALVVNKGEGISLINEKCEIIAKLDNSISWASRFCNGYCAVKDDNNKVGFIDATGKVVIKPKYDSADYFSEDGIAIVGKNVNDSVTNYFAIDKAGKELFKFSSTEYQDHSSFINGHIVVQKSNNDILLLDKEGKKGVSLGKWSGYIPSDLGLRNNLIVFKDGDSYGLKDEKGNIVLRAKYDSLIPISIVNENYFLAEKQDKYGVIDKDDKEIIAFDYSILAVINKTTLVQGDKKMFSFMNFDGKDVGQNNYVNLSFWSGSEIKSNYFNAQRKAAQIIEHMTESSFFGSKVGDKLNDFRDKLDGYKYLDMDKNYIKESEYPFDLMYVFDRHLSGYTYEYIFGYRFPKDVEYNYSANMIVTLASLDLSEYQPGAEEELLKALTTQVKNLGFTTNTEKGIYIKNDKTGTAVGFGYDKGIFNIAYVYDSRFMIDLDRNVRAEDAEVEVDQIDTFGLDKITPEEDVDSVAVVEAE